MLEVGCLSFALLQATATSIAYAQSVDVSQDGTALVFSGEIGSGALNEFNEALSSAPAVTTITLASPGGLVVPAMEIASIVHALGISTEIPSGAICASACSIIFLAGEGRQALGQLGVHQMSADGSGAVSGVQFILAEMLDAFENYGVDRRVSRHMLTTPPEAMYFFSDFELKEYGINRTGEEAVAAAAGFEARQTLPFTDFQDDSSNVDTALTRFWNDKSRAKRSAFKSLISKNILVAGTGLEHCLARYKAA